jgi:hypothetical protein
MGDVKVLNEKLVRILFACVLRGGRTALAIARLAAQWRALQTIRYFSKRITLGAGPIE